MNDGARPPDAEDDQAVQDLLQRQPHLLMRLAENSLIVAESLRNNYLKNTAKFVNAFRRAMVSATSHRRPNALLTVHDATQTEWSDYPNDVVTFIDGGVGRVQISNQIPILLRVGSYCVHTGERSLMSREQFGYYPVILGDLEGGSKERKDFPDIVRITAELLGGLSALERDPNLDVLMFHGPLIYMVGAYAGHTPFTERDIDLFLNCYVPGPTASERLKTEFLGEAQLDIYPAMTRRSDEWVARRLFEPLAWIAFLCRKLVHVAKRRTTTPIIAGVVERGDSREFAEKVLLERVFRSLRQRGNVNYFNELFGRTDLTSPRAMLDRLAYTDTLLLAMLLRGRQRITSWLRLSGAGRKRLVDRGRRV